MSNGEREFTLHDFFALLGHRWSIIVGCAVILGVFLTLVALAGEPVYEARGTIQITALRGGIGGAADLLSLAGGSPLLNSEVEILRSRTVVQAVIDDIDMKLVPRDITHGGPITTAFMFVFADRLKRDLRFLRVDKVAFPPESVDGSFILTFTDDSGNFRLRGPGGDLGAGSLNAPFESDRLSFTVTSIKGPAGTRFLLRPRASFETYRSFQEQLKVAALGGATRSNLITVTFRTTNPSLAGDVVNGILTEYENRDREWKAGLSESQSEQIQARLAQALTDLQAAEDALEEYKNTYGVMLLPDEARLAIGELADREAGRVDLELRLSQLQQIHRSLAGSLHEDTFSVPPSLTADPVIQQLAAEHARLTVELDGLLLDYTENHPLVIAKRDSIRGVRENILGAISATINSLVELHSEISGLIAQLEARLYSMPGVERDLAQLTRNQQVADDTYRMLVRKLDEARLVESSFLIGNRIIDTAVPPERPVAPSIKINLGMGLGLGLVLGIFLAFLIDLTDTRLRRADQLERLLSAAGLARLRKDDTATVSTAASMLALAAMRADRPIIALVCPGPDSPQLREILERLIWDLAAGLRPVLLVDTSPETATGFFGAGAAPGISEMAAGESVSPQAVGDGRILVLPAGSTPSTANVTSRLVRERVAALQAVAPLTGLTVYYLANYARDHALRGWASMSAGAVLVACRNLDFQRAVHQACDALAADKVPILGGLFVE